MTRVGFWGALAILCASSAIAQSVANPVERACRVSGREAASVELCACIGVAATLVLTERDQARAAQLLNDPQEAQDVRRSNRRRDEVFWQQYQSFIGVAEDICG